jgi:hypothetical protein
MEVHSLICQQVVNLVSGSLTLAARVRADVKAILSFYSERVWQPSATNGVYGTEFPFERQRGDELCPHRLIRKLRIICRRYRILRVRYLRARH